MRLFFVISLFFTLSVFQNLKAQTIPMGGGDCQTAALVCNTSVTIEDTIYFGHSAGAQQVGAGSATPGCWSKGEIWPFWYTFTVATSGSFEFILTPFNGSIRNDWDWMLFDVTGGCGTISNANLVACNFSNDCNTSTGISSINRASWTGTCNIFNNPWENTINLTAGRTYSLIVDAFEFPGANFRIRFNQNNLPDAVTFLDINADFTANPNPVCSGSSISFTNNSTGQPGMPLSYQWNFGDGNTSTSANPTHTYAAPGTYTVTLRAFNTSCQDIHTLNVTVAQPIAITSTINYVSCNGGSNGGVNINSVTGGIPPYSYLWSNGATSQNLGGVTAGSYSLTITDAINCTNTFNFTITEPPPISITSSVTNVSCNAGSNGAISINPVTGGTPPYSYLWSNGSTSQNISGLTAGSYNVTITDANTCTRNFSFTITEPLPITATANITNVTCNNGNNGSINLTSVSGGLAPYSYLWSNGATTQNINSLTAGSYTVTITDANNCSSANTFNVTQPAPISASSSITNVSCNGGNNGAIDITPSGGTAPYTFLWAGGQTSEDILGLTAGTYSVTITDANLCQRNFSFNVTEPAVISTTSTVNNASCNGSNNGSINLNTVSGGTAPYTFAWSNGANTQNISGLAPGPYSVTITDANLCTGTFNFNITEPALIAVTESLTHVTCNNGSNGAIILTSVTGGTAPYTFTWSNGATTQNISNVTANNYTVTVRDNNNCQQDFSFTINQPTAITTTASITDASCNGGNNGAIDITSVSGGTAPYSYAWSNGATTDDISGVTAGAYTLTVTDANNCTATFNYNVGQPVAINAVANITNVSCNGGNNGAIDITPSGGTAPYTFLWAGGQTSEDISGLTAGTYSVTITDANLCQRNFSFNVTEPAVISTTSTVNNASCNGSNNGSINLNTVSGGTAPYTFAWSNGANTQNISGLAPGPYSVTITDANLCTGTFNFNITEPALIAVTESLTHVTCNNGSNGAITLTSVTGGTAPYTFTWSNGATTQNISNLTANNYTVTVRDNNNCQQDFNFTINQPAAITTTASITDASCNGGNNGAIDITSVNGGTAPYSYAWSNGANTDDISGLNAGAYTLTVTDGNNCTATFNYNVGQPVAINAVANITNVSCNGGNNGAIDITPSGGTAPYTFLWAGGQTSEDISGLTAGTYSVTITDANLCQRNFSFNVTEPAVISTTSTVNNA
ncbi:MAG: beta strand repeat-containing protein, partial [Cytophagaceae bacterium]